MTTDKFNREYYTEASRLSKRIVLVPSSYFPDVGGVQEICRNLSTELKSSGHQVSIIVNRFPKDLCEAEVMDGIEVRRFDFHSPNRSFSGFFSLHRLVLTLVSLSIWLHRSKPDIVHVICPSSSSFYLWLAKLFGQWKLLVTLQGEIFMDAHQIYQRSAFARWALQNLLSVSDGITACSEYVLNHARSHFRLPIWTRVIFNGVDLTESANFTNAALPNSYILGVGRLVENKGFETLLSAFQQTCRADSEIALVIAGGGEFGSTLKSLAEQLGISNRIHFIGWKDRGQIAALFERCRFFVMPSPVEPFGIVCLESMRAGKAQIVTRTGGPSEFLVDGVSALFVDASNCDQLASQMNHLLQSPDECQRLGMAGFEKVSEFSWPTIARQYRDIYENIVLKS